MAKRRRRQKTEAKTGWSAGQVVLAAAVLLIFAFFLQSANGIRHGLLGSYVWATAFILAFLIALERSARFILPNEIPNSHLEAYTLLLRYASRVMLPEPIRQLVGIKGFPPAPREVAESFQQLGVGFVDSHYCLALVRGANYSRAAGPGFVKLNPGEMIRHVIDLRPHIRSIPVKATTKDGIIVETRLTVVFRVRQNPGEWLDSNSDPDSRFVFPYARDAIFRISFASGIRESEEEIFWTERIAPTAAAILITALSGTTLDELYQTGDPNAAPLDSLTRKVKNILLDHIRPIFGHTREEDNPLDILGVSVDAPILPLDVLRQRVQNWQTAWQRRIFLQRATGDAEAVRHLKMARARVQLELIENIINNIDLMRRNTDLDLAEIVTLRVLETLEHTAQSDVDHGMLIPNRVMNTMAQIKAVLHSYEGDEPNVYQPTTPAPPLPGTPTRRMR